jgi:hypothetical protein
MVKVKKVSTKSKSRKPVPKSRARKTAKASKRTKPPAKSKSSKAFTKSTKSPKAMRLTFSYDGDKVKLVSQQPVEMIVPPSDPVKGFANQKGFWAELKGEQDKTLYRSVMHNPTRNDAEVFSDEPEQSISREPAPRRKGVFVLVVPDTDKGREVTLSRSSPEVRGPARGIRALAAKPATEIARFKLKK